MGPAPGAGQDVVDALGLTAAVLAGVLVTAEDGAPGDGDTAPVGNLHEAGELDHRGHHHRLPLGLPHLVAVDHRHRPAPHDEHHRPSGRNDRQWFVGGVENQSPDHRLPVCPEGAG